MTKSAVKVAHAGAIATWAVSVESYAKELVSNRTTFGTGRFAATELIEQALNGRVPTAYDQLQDDDRATRLARDYNDRFNNLRLRSFDGST